MGVALRLQQPDRQSQSQRRGERGRLAQISDLRPRPGARLQRPLAPAGPQVAHEHAATYGHSGAVRFFAKIRRPHSARLSHAQGRCSRSFMMAIWRANSSKLDDLSARQFMPPLGRWSAFAESVKKLARFRQAETAGLRALQYSQSLQNRRAVLPSTANPDGLRQNAGLLVKPDRGSSQTRFLRHLSDRHTVSLLDLKLTLTSMMVT